MRRTSPTPSPHQASLGSARTLAAASIGELMGFWNFKPSMGRVWTELYLSPTPLTADEIQCATGMSAGTVSMTLHDLVDWEVVHRAEPEGRDQPPDQHAGHDAAARPHRLAPPFHSDRAKYQRRVQAGGQGEQQSRQCEAQDRSRCIHWGISVRAQAS